MQPKNLLLQFILGQALLLLHIIVYYILLRPILIPLSCFLLQQIGATSTEAMKEEVVHNPCGICSNTLDEGETVKLRAKGADTINKASTEHGPPSITVSEGQMVHIDCRKKHVNTKPNRISGKQKKRPE